MAAAAAAAACCTGAASSSSSSPSSSLHRTPLLFLHRHSFDPSSYPPRRALALHRLPPPVSSLPRHHHHDPLPLQDLKRPLLPTLPSWTSQNPKILSWATQNAKILSWATQNPSIRRIWDASATRAPLVLLALPTIAGFNLEGPQSVIEALGVLAAIITVHECGHFLAAYLQGIHIAQFSIGFGPTLVKLQGKKVEYSLRAVPLGGFVAFPDDDPESDYPPDDPDLLKNRPIRDRLLVVSAGVVANIIFAYFILFGQALTTGLLQQEVFPGVVVPDVLATSVAARAGVQAGDVILGVDGKTLPAGENCVYDLVYSIKNSPDRELSFLVSREGKQLEIQLVPEKNFDGSGKIGVQLGPNARPVKVKAKDLADATVRASKEFARLFGTVVDGLRQVIFNFSQTADKISGPVAIVAVGAEVARTDVAGLSQFAAIVNINLAVVNILPLPALDGGYLVLIVLEALRGGKKLPNKLEQGIMSSGILLLLALGTFLMVRDALNLGFVQML